MRLLVSNWRQNAFSVVDSFFSVKAAAAGFVVNVWCLAAGGSGEGSSILSGGAIHYTEYIASFFPSLLLL
jgi:hypothetical protein